MSDFNIVSVNTKNVEELGFFCVKNKKHAGYTNQCPYIGKAVVELPPVAEQHGI